MKSEFNELKYFGRYRDDCLSLWCGTREKLESFFNFLNSLNDDLKFTMEIGNDKLCFLDLEIKLENNKLHTTVYSKPTDAHLYLHATSCHNKLSIKGIPKGVALRLRRICSSDAEYDIKSNEYINYLLKRGYDEKSTRATFNSLKAVPIQTARKKVTKNRQSNFVIFATNFNPRGPDVASIVKKNLPILEKNPVLSNLFPKGTVMVANKKENNLRNLLTRSDPYSIKKDLTTTTELGYVCCDKSCDSCVNYVVQTSAIVSKATGRKFNIRRESTCTTKNVVYVAVCKTCGKQGVGSTVTWKTRLANYKSHIKNKIPTCRIVKHFIDDCRDDTLKNLYFIIVDVVNNTENLTKNELEEILLKKEKFWIGTLVTQHQGLNGTHDWNRLKRTEREKEI